MGCHTVLWGIIPTQGLNLCLCLLHCRQILYHWDTWRNANQNYTMMYHLALVRMAIIKKSINNKCWRGCGEKGNLLHSWQESKFAQPLWKFLASLVAQLVKNPPAMWETWVQSLDCKDSLEKEKATYFSILAWRVLYTPWGHKELDTTTHWKRPWCWDGLGEGGGGDDRGWDGWMAWPTRWAWVWVNSGSWWWTGRPGVLQFMGSQRVGHDWATELN